MEQRYMNPFMRMANDPQAAQPQQNPMPDLAGLNLNSNGNISQEDIDIRLYREQLTKFITEY